MLMIVGKTTDGKFFVRDASGLRTASAAELRAEANNHVESADMHRRAATRIREQLSDQQEEKDAVWRETMNREPNSNDI